MKLAHILLALLWGTASCVAQSATNSFRVEIACKGFQTNLYAKHVECRVGECIPVTLKVTYLGTNEVQVQVLKYPFVDLYFDAPPSWERRKMIGPISLEGVMGPITLRKDDAMELETTLDQFFTGITSGDFEIPYTFKLWPYNETNAPLVVHTNLVRLKVPEMRSQYLKEEPRQR